MALWVWLLAAAAMAIDAWVTWTLLADPGGPNANPGEFGWTLVLWVFAFSGALIVSRKPGNVIGWLLLLPGIASPLSSLATVWLTGFEAAPPTITLPIWLALWFTGISWVLLIFPVLHLMLTFPTGRLLTRRWRWVAWLEGTMLGAFLALAALTETLEFFIGDDLIWSVPNPIGILPPTFWDTVFGPVWGALLALLTVSCVAAVVQRFRKSLRVERQQMKWLLLAVGFFGVVFAIQAILNSQDGPSGVADALFGISLASIPIAIAVAVLRYRLYDIDRLVSRTVSYAVVVGLLAAVFFGIIALLTSLLDTQSDVTIAASTLSVFALFNPLRKRVQNGVDRRFNRSRYDSGRVMDGFAASLKDRVDSDEVVSGWVGVVNQTMEPSSIGVWLRNR